MEYLKLFENHSQYADFIKTEDFVRPNVSHCIEQNEMHYNPIDPFKGHEYVDLGLPSGTLWAKMNVGANSETDYGLYFAWGETTGYPIKKVDGNWVIDASKQFNASDYAFANVSTQTITKYNATDGKTALDLEDDAAHVNMGGDWHMPNRAQCIELFKETKNGFVTNEGSFTQYAWDDTNGYSSPTETTAAISGWNTTGYFFFKSDVSDMDAAVTSSDYLFIPAASVCLDGEVHGVGIYGGVWASALNSGNVERAWGFGFDSSRAGVGSSVSRCGGQSVRGVVGEAPELISHTWYEDHLEIVLSKSATNVKLIYQRVQGHDPAPEELTLTSSDGITWITSELSKQYGHCADMTVVANGIAIGSWSERNGCLT